MVDDESVGALGVEVGQRLLGAAAEAVAELGADGDAVRGSMEMEPFGGIRNRATRRERGHGAMMDSHGAPGEQEEPRWQRCTREEIGRWRARP